MRIGIDARLALTNSRGHGKYIRGLIKGLLEVDQQNQYVLYVDAPDQQSVLSGYQNARLVELAPTNYILWEQIVFPRRLRKDKVDLVFLSNHTAPLFCSTPSVVTVHDVLYLDPISLRQSLRQVVGRAYKRLCTPWSAHYARRVMADSEYSKQQIIRRLGIPADKVTVTYAGVDPIFRQLSIGCSKPILTKYGLEPREYLFCLGATDPRKNTKRVLECYQRLKSLGVSKPRLVIGGMSKTECTRLLAHSESSDLMDGVVFTGFVTDEELVALYSQANLFLYLSLGEGFGLPVLESFACGTPVIASNVTSVPEVAGEAALLVNPTSETELVQAIAQFLSDDRLRAEYKRRGLERVKQFSWQTVAGHTLSVFESVISGS